MRKSFIICLFLIMTAGAGYSVDLDGTVVQLQFFTQTYRLNESIPVLMNVVNNSADSFTFDVSSEIDETFFFEVKTPLSEEIGLTDEFGIEREENESSSEYYRSIELEANESFSHQIDLNEWYDFTEAGYYYIKGQFYPNPDNSSELAESIYYKILIKPPLIVEEALTVAEQERQVELEEAAQLPPYLVIEDLLQAKTEKDWERFLLHIDSEKLISSFQNFSDEYDNARTGALQLEIIEEFEQYLTEYWQDTILTFQVTETTITSEDDVDEADVVCEVEYLIRDLSYIVEYTFELYQNHEGQWLVEDYYAHRLE